MGLVKLEASKCGWCVNGYISIHQTIDNERILTFYNQLRCHCWLKLMSTPPDTLLLHSSTTDLLVYAEKDTSGSVGYHTRLLEPHNDNDINENPHPTVSITQNKIDILNNHIIYVIDSVKSGKPGEGKQGFFNTVLKTVLNFAGVHNYTYLKTSSSESIKQFATLIKQKSLSSSKILLLFLSGDTVMFEFLNFFYYLYSTADSLPQTYILPFPHGTGNALANSLKLYTDLDSLKSLFLFQPAHLPIYNLKTHSTITSVNKSLSTFIHNPSILFLIVASWGLHSNLVYESDKPEMREKYGAERFKIAANKVLAENPIFKGSIQTNENNYYVFNSQLDKWESTTFHTYQDLSYFLLTAVSNLEKTFEISPNSKISQDLLHLVAIPHIESNKVMKLMYEAYNHGAHVNDKLVLYEQLKSLTLDIQSSDPEKLDIICLDGSLWEISGKFKQLNFSLLQHSFLYVLT